MQQPFPPSLPRGELSEGHAFLCRPDFEDVSLRIGLLLFLFALFSSAEAQEQGDFWLIVSGEKVLRYASRPFWPGFSRAVGFYRREGLDIVRLPEGKIGCIAKKRAFRGIFRFVRRLPGREKDRLSVFLRADFSVFLEGQPSSPCFSAGFSEEKRGLFDSLCSSLLAAGYSFSVSASGFFGTEGCFSRGRRRISVFCGGQDGFFLRFRLNRAQTALAYRNLSSLSPPTASFFLHERDCSCRLCRSMFRQTVYRFRVWNAPYADRRLCLDISSREILADALVLLHFLG